MVSFREILTRVLIKTRDGLVYCWKRRDLRNLFVLALVLRLVLFWEGCHQAGLEGMAYGNYDVATYMKMASSLLDGGVDVERYFFTFGPGHAYYLALLMVIFKNSLSLMVLFNILISSLSVLMIYRIGMALTGSRSVGIVAGAIIATSYTSITLSCTLLSDTFYYFLFTSALAAFFAALESRRWVLYILSGVLFGFAALTRSVGQFFPVIVIAIGVVHLQKSRQGGVPRSSRLPLRQKPLFKSFVTAAVAVLIIGIWVIRNAIVVGVPVLSMSGAWGLAKIASHAQEDIENRPYQEISKEWFDAELERLGKKSLTCKESYNLGRSIGLTVLKEHPRELLSTYLHWTWYNMTEISYSHRTILPDIKDTLIDWEYYIREKGLNYICFILSVLGLLVLLFKRQWYVATVLSLIYLYFVPLIGFSTYQGSRIFFPASVAWAVMVAIVLVTVGRPLIRWSSSICTDCGRFHRSQ